MYESCLLSLILMSSCINFFASFHDQTSRGLLSVSLAPTDSICQATLQWDNWSKEIPEGKRRENLSIFILFLLCILALTFLVTLMISPNSGLKVDTFPPYLLQAWSTNSTLPLLISEYSSIPVCTLESNLNYGTRTLIKITSI